MANSVPQASDHNAPSLLVPRSNLALTNFASVCFIIENNRDDRCPDHRTRSKDFVDEIGHFEYQESIVKL